MRRILWFRRDLRIEDNPLLSLEGEVLPIFIFDTHILTKLPSHDRRVALIFTLVMRLKKALQSRGLDLKLFWGTPEAIFSHLILLGFDEVAASGDYDAYARKRDTEISRMIEFHYLQDTYIFAPDAIHKEDATPYRVFTPFYKKAKTLYTPDHAKSFSPAEQKLIQTDYEGITLYDKDRMRKLACRLESLGFTPSSVELPDPQSLLEALPAILKEYETRRDFPALGATSHLSVALRLGMLSIRELLRFLARQEAAGLPTQAFFRQLIFRDFYAYVLYHFPHVEKENYKYPFNGIEDKEAYEKFCSAQTGVPIVDAGITQLLQTGRMHNRLRMICASFLTKDLLLPWQWGEAFFARHLLDFDTASNVLSWQWSAGTGIDPQPYFRIFNPYAQSKKFDPDGRYITRWLPQLKELTPAQLHDENYLFNHTVDGYPQPMLLHKEAAQRALAYFKSHPKGS